MRQDPNTEWLEQLRSCSERRDLARQLGADEDRIYAYYLCPLPTLPLVMAEGIRCRNTVADAIDLSSPDVQNRRRSINLGRVGHDGRTRVLTVQTHSCVNLYWNPRNRTFEAFQRNALLRSAQCRDSQIRTVCILEVDVESVLADEATYWAASQGNIAAGARPTCEPLMLESYPWADIYASAPGNANRASAAELVLLLKTEAGTHSAPVAPRYIKRVIGPVAGARHISQTHPSVGTSLWHCSDVYKSAGELLHAETKFIENMADLGRYDGHLSARLRATTHTLSDFEREHADRDDSLSARSGSAHGWHGTGHATRVMFWAVYLTSCAVGLGHTPEYEAAALCAFLHDRNRRSSGPDPGHGAAAADSFRSVIGTLHDAQLRRSCESAVRFHDLDDADCPAASRDWLWEALKDADALDRGRFGPPDTKSGCRVGLLRMSWLGNSDAAARARLWLAWAGWWLAGITKSSQWGSSTCQRLLIDLRSGLSAGLEEEVFPGALREAARQILTALEIPSG